VSSQYTLYGVSWCAVGFGMAGSARLCGWLRYLVVVGEAGVCVSRCSRRRRVGCLVIIGGRRMCFGLAPCIYVRVGARVALQRRCRECGVWNGGDWGDSSRGVGVCQ
jgi:hypothetical protein